MTTRSSLISRLKRHALSPILNWRLRRVRGLSAVQRIAAIGHRRFVGGMDAEHWYGIGKLQYHFLVGRGLQPEHHFLDVACGSLRLGQFLIPYLQPGNYAGLEGEQALIDMGLAVELTEEIAASRRPRFFCNYDFNLEGYGGFDYAIAQSLFTHLTAADIGKCFARLRPYAKPGAQFFFTYGEGDSGRNPNVESHANRDWRYQFEELEVMAADNGWTASRIGAWGHPRGQMMAVASPT